MPHDYSPLLLHLATWLDDYIVVLGSNIHSEPCISLSWQIKPAKIEFPLFCIDVAQIVYRGLYHVQFLPGASADNIREISKVLSHFKLT